MTRFLEVSLSYTFVLVSSRRRKLASFRRHLRYFDENSRTFVAVVVVVSMTIINVFSSKGIFVFVWSVGIAVHHQQNESAHRDIWVWRANNVIRHPHLVNSSLQRGLYNLAYLTSRRKLVYVGPTSWLFFRFVLRDYYTRPKWRRPKVTRLGRMRWICAPVSGWLTGCKYDQLV